MIGGCRCKNLTLNWQIRDFSIVPRACQCDYCISKSAAYVAKPGSTFSLNIKYAKLYQQGTPPNSRCQHNHRAAFHECLLCNELVAVTCAIDNLLYGIVNVNSLAQRERFPAAKAIPFTDKPKALTEQLQQRALNWSSRVSVNININDSDS